MVTVELKKERRQQKRFAIGNGAFALLNWQDSEVLGAIKDISGSGLCLHHIDDQEDLGAPAKITIKLISENFCYENFIGRCIWSKKEEGVFTTAMVKMKRCGIAFAQLNDVMQLQIQDFISSLQKNNTENIF